MAELTVETVLEAGLQPSYVAAASGGDSFKNDGKTIVHVKNGDASPHTPTFVAQKTAVDVSGYGATAKVDGGSAVPATDDEFFGPFPTTAFNDLNGLCQITYDAVTSVTVAVLKVA